MLSDKSIDEELFTYTGYLAKECKTDLSDWFKPFAEHENKTIKSQAEYILKQLQNDIELTPVLNLCLKLIVGTFVKTVHNLQTHCEK